MRIDLHDNGGERMSRGNVDEREALKDRPSQSLLKNWGRKLSRGKAAVVPVYVGGGWTCQIVRGNKRVLQVPFKPGKN